MTKNSYAYINVKGVECGVELATLDTTGEVYGFYVETPNDVYEVCPQVGGHCTCPHYRIRLRGTKKTCKHIDAVREAIADGELPPVCGRIPQPEVMS